MIFTFILLLGAISLLALAYGFNRGAMGTAIIGAILLVALGGIILTEGIEYGPVIKTTDTTTYILTSTTTYTTYTAGNNLIVWILGVTGFYGGLASLIGCFYFSVRGEKNKEEEQPF